MSISTHVLDTALGRPAAGVPVTLERQESGQWVTLGGGPTDADGRQKTLLGTASLDAGEYRITFELAAYQARQGVQGFYPRASIEFTVTEAGAHHHVPLLVSPFGYSTYRGS